MSGIDRLLTLDSKHIAKHLPDTPQMQKLLNKEGFVHVFNDAATLERVAIEIMERGEFIGTIRGHDRYGLYFSEPIGYRMSTDGTKRPLYYGEMKIKGEKYHSSATYKEAKLWLLEDEYERFEQRFHAEKVA